LKMIPFEKFSFAACLISLKPKVKSLLRKQGGRMRKKPTPPKNEENRIWFGSVRETRPRSVYLSDLPMRLEIF
jgi:hypothetical protein